jgi:hypothetical protein
VTLVNGMTIALAGEPNGEYALFNVWVGEYTGSPRYVLSDHWDAEASYLAWTAFQDMFVAPADIHITMKNIADELLGHTYVARCSVGSTLFIRKPIKFKIVRYGWS